MMYNILLNFCAEKTLEMCEKAVDKEIQEFEICSIFSYKP